MLNIILYSLIAGVVGTGTGGLIGTMFNRDSSKTMSVLLSFAGGVMLSIVFMDLLPESISNSTLLISIGSVLLGIILVYSLNFIIDLVSYKKANHYDESHPKFHDGLDELVHSDCLIDQLSQKEMNRKKLFNAGILMIAAISLHNLPEGMAIGSSISHDYLNGSILSTIVLFHNIPEGMAIAVPLIAGGMSRIKTVLLTALSGLPTVIGAAIGFMLGEMTSFGVSISLGIASGAMITVVFTEILPQALFQNKSRTPAIAAIIGILLGVIIVSL